LLRWSIERFRETRQGPMLSRASDMFMGLTQGAFSKLVVDYEVEPLKLTGQRATGALVEIAGMSEGTRDQLYLALRLAALELHLEQTVPLPLIADDLCAYSPTTILTPNGCVRSLPNCSKPWRATTLKART
jgi:uncharacterized protein YhaN